jgi:hypothetical protein
MSGNRRLCSRELKDWSIEVVLQSDDAFLRLQVIGYDNAIHGAQQPSRG